MRRWIGRAFWLAAWSFWVSLGFGLAHHLPKRSGELVCAWKRKPEERVLCFLNDQKEFATLDPPAALGPSVISMRDVATGAVTREFPGPLTYVNYINYDSSPRFPFIVTSQNHRPDGGVVGDPDGLAILDLRTGRWSRIMQHVAGFGLDHPTLPLSMGRSGDNLVVVDVERKKVVFRWSPPRAPFLSFSSVSVKIEPPYPFFIGDDRVGIPIVRESSWLGMPSKSNELEVWSLREPSGPPQVFKNVETGVIVNSGGSRLVWSRRFSKTSQRVEVLDLEAGRVVFPRDRLLGTERYNRPLGLLSRDGRRLVIGGPTPGTTQLIDIDSEDVLWTADRNESAWSGGEGTDAFLTTQDWSFNFFGWSKELYTWTYRSRNDGSVLFRSWDRAPFPGAESEGGLYFADDGVRRLPLRFDWGLLSFCQTILSLPLVVLWAALRWRRKRRMQKASAVA